MPCPKESRTGHGGCVFVEMEGWEDQFIRQHCRECGQFRCYPGEVTDELIPEISDAEVLSVFLYTRLTAETIERFERLRMIASRSTGFDHIDLDACRRRGITVCNVPEYGSNTVAEHTFSLILALTRKIHKAYQQTVRADFSQEGLRGVDLKGRTLGVIGTGAIGRHVCRIARGFDMSILAYDIQPNEELADRLDVTYTDLDDVLRRSDIVTLHCPHNEKTHHMIGERELGLMKAGAFLINTARGGLVDPKALLVAVRDGQIGGAGLDVLEGERAIKEEKEILTERYDMDALQTLVRNHALLRQDNVVITPHMAFNSQEALQRILDTTVRNIANFLAGHPQNVVSAPKPEQE